MTEGKGKEEEEEEKEEEIVVKTGNRPRFTFRALLHVIKLGHFIF